VSTEPDTGATDTQPEPAPVTEIQLHAGPIHARLVPKDTPDLILQGLGIFVAIMVCAVFAWKVMDCDDPDQCVNCGRDPIHYDRPDEPPPRLQPHPSTTPQPAPEPKEDP
jgi:hypothetical protein